MSVQPPFNMLLVGMTGCGKTYFFLDMIESEYKKVFDYIVIICPTIEWNTMPYINWKHLKETGVIPVPCSQESVNEVLSAVPTIFKGLH
jgi:GTPase SAR1 family protein